MLRLVESCTGSFNIIVEVTCINKVTICWLIVLEVLI